MKQVIEALIKLPYFVHPQTALGASWGRGDPGGQPRGTVVFEFIPGKDDGDMEIWYDWYGDMVRIIIMVKWRLIDYKWRLMTFNMMKWWLIMVILSVN